MLCSIPWLYTPVYREDRREGMCMECMEYPTVSLDIPLHSMLPEVVCQEPQRPPHHYLADLTLT